MGEHLVAVTPAALCVIDLAYLAVKHAMLFVIATEHRIRQSIAGEDRFSSKLVMKISYLKFSVVFRYLLSQLMVKFNSHCSLLPCIVKKSNDTKTTCLSMKPLYHIFMFFSIVLAILCLLRYEFMLRRI